MFTQMLFQRIINMLFIILLQYYALMCYIFTYDNKDEKKIIHLIL